MSQSARLCARGNRLVLVQAVSFKHMDTEALQDSSIVGVRAGGLASAPLDCCGWRLLLLKELEKQQSSVARAHAA